LRPENQSIANRELAFSLLSHPAARPARGKTMRANRLALAILLSIATACAALEARRAERIVQYRVYADLFPFARPAARAA
jgi:hypothetical protein